MKEPSLPICLSCQIERKLDPKEPFFTTLGGGGEGVVYIQPRQSGL